MDDKEKVKQEVRQEINRYGRKTLYASSLLSIPFVYITYLIFHNRFSENVVFVIGMGIYILVLTIIIRLIRNWLHKKPASSGWYNWLD